MNKRQTTKENEMKKISDYNIFECEEVSSENTQTENGETQTTIYKADDGTLIRLIEKFDTAEHYSSKVEIV